MSNINPEKQFLSEDLSAYTGMVVEEYTFCRLENYDGEMQDYKLDVITAPEAADAPRPVVIFVHGGGFVQPNDKRQSYVPIFAKSLTEAGYAVVSPDYPVFHNHAERGAWNKTLGADRAAEAVHLAYQYVKENAEKFNFDPGHIAVMGGSAGGMTCFYLLEHYDVDVKMFGNCWGAPLYQPIDVSSFPPTLSIHGTADPIVPYERTLSVQDEFTRFGIPHELISIAGAGHTPVQHFQSYVSTLLEWLDRYMKN